MKRSLVDCVYERVFRVQGSLFSVKGILLSGQGTLRMRGCVIGRPTEVAMGGGQSSTTRYWALRLLSVNPIERVCTFHLFRCQVAYPKPRSLFVFNFPSVPYLPERPIWTINRRNCLLLVVAEAEGR